MAQTSDQVPTTMQQPNVVSRYTLTLLRLYLSMVFFMAAWPKISDLEGWTGRFGAVMGNFANNSHDFYRAFLESVVIPNATLFGNLTAFGETFTAIALLFGLFTRFAALAGMFLVFNYMLAKGMWFWVPASNDSAFFFIGLVLLIGAGGRALGVDQYLHQRWPNIPLW